MRIDTRYNIGDKIFLVAKPEKDKSATYKVLEAEIESINATVYDNYTSYYYGTDKNIDFYEEKLKENIYYFNTEKEAIEQAKFFREIRLKEIKEEREEEKSYIKYKLDEKLKEIKKEAKKYNIKL